MCHGDTKNHLRQPAQLHVSDCANWSVMPDSNWRLLTWKDSTLPTELMTHNCNELSRLSHVVGDLVCSDSEFSQATLTGFNVSAHASWISSLQYHCDLELNRLYRPRRHAQITENLSPCMRRRCSSAFVRTALSNDTAIN